MDTDIIGFLLGAVSFVVVIYYAFIVRLRIILLTEQIDALTWQVTSQTQRADLLCATITKHLEAKGILFDEIDKLEARNRWLEHKRSSRNAPSMKHAAQYGHHRGHSA